MKTKTITMTVVRTFPRENMMIVRYAGDTFMVEHQPGAKVGEGVRVQVETD